MQSSSAGSSRQRARTRSKNSGLRFDTPRYSHAVVEGVDVKGRPVRVEGTGYFARCLQHECGHLRGEVYIDTLSGEARREALRAIRSAPA